MEDQVKTFTQKTEVVFTTIEISQDTGLLNNKFAARFKAGETKEKLKDVFIKSNDIKSCIKNVSEFLGCEISEKHYIIK